MDTNHSSSGRYRFVNQWWRTIVCLAVALGIASPAMGQVQEEWVARYNGSGSGWDSAYRLAVDSGGNVYAAGWAYDSATGYDYLTIKYDRNGNLLWERRYDGSAGRTDWIAGLAVDGAGNVYVTGSSIDSATGYDIATLKYDQNGSLLWVRRYNGIYNGSDGANAIAVDEAGNVYVAGQAMVANHLGDFMTLKYDSDGNLLWHRSYDSPGNEYDYVKAIALDSAGNLIVHGPSDWGAWYTTIKYDPDGNVLWISRNYGPGTIYNTLAAIGLDTEGNVFVTTESGTTGTDFDYKTIKLDPNGNLLWERIYNGPANGSDRINEIAVDTAGNAYVTGASEGVGTGSDYLTLKYDPNGNLLWERRFNGPNNGSDGATAITIDVYGDLFVTGQSEGLGTGTDITTIKYDADGNELWQIRYNGPASGADVAWAIAVDNASNVYVAGESTGAGTGEDTTTIKYSQVPSYALPDSFSLFRGILTGGGLSDLFASDDSWMTVRPGITLNQAERQVQLIVTGTAPTETPSELRFRLEAHASINNIGQWIELWNYDTGAYEQVDYMVATTVDSIVEVTITVDPGRFIQAATRQMKAKISYKEAGIVLTFPWLISFDQTVWVIVP